MTTPTRVRRVRVQSTGFAPVEATAEAPPQRVRRVRSAPQNANPKPYFLIDWDRPLSWKLSIYLCSSYLYYLMNFSVLTDHDYDRLCKELAAGWRTLRHQHKHVVSFADLKAGTGYSIKAYPLIVEMAAQHMRENYHETRSHV